MVIINNPPRKYREGIHHWKAKIRVLELINKVGILNNIDLECSYEYPLPEVLTTFGPMTYHADAYVLFIDSDSWINHFSVEIDGIKSEWRTYKNKIRDMELWSQLRHKVYRFPTYWIVPGGTNPKLLPLDDSDIIKDCEIFSRYINTMPEAKL